MIQLKVVRRITSSIYCEPNRKPGDVVWVDEKGARELVEGGFCELHAAAAAPPEMTAETAGDIEAAPAQEPTVKKSAGEATHGPSIASPWWNVLGKVRLSCASAAALLRPRRL